VGVQLIENSGVVEEKKNVMAIESIPIMAAEDIGMDESVEVAIEMPDMVLEAGIDIDIEPIVPVDMSMALPWDEIIWTKLMILQ
jgi:hypothetical protein